MKLLHKLEETSKRLHAWLNEPYIQWEVTLTIIFVRYKGFTLQIPLFPEIKIRRIRK